jgi:hypothetical protein
MLKRITFKVGEDSHVIVVDDDEDAKAILREKLGIKRLPNGVEKTSVVDVKLSEMTKPELKLFVSRETPRYERLASYCERFPDMGPGWVIARDNCKKDLDIAKGLLG